MKGHMSLQTTEQEARAALEHRRQADEAAAEAQERATAKYDGTDKTYKPVEAADAARRRTALDLSLAEKAHKQALAAIAAHNRAELSAEYDSLLAGVGERAFHRSVADEVEAIRRLDPELCAAFARLTDKVRAHNGRVSRLEIVESELWDHPRRERADRRTMKDVSMITSALVATTRRERGDAVPSIDTRIAYGPGDLPETLLATRRPASFSNTEATNAEREAARYLANTTTKEDSQ